MDPDDIQRFIASYTPADEESIRFDWNGKHADEFEDRNMEFRNLVREAVLDDLDSAPLPLVRDLYRAETRCSYESWGICDGVGLLAERLVKTGGEAYLDDFLDGKFQSFDASCGSNFPVDLPLAERLLGIVRRRLEAGAQGDEADQLRSGEDLFLDWVEHCRSQAK